MTIVDLNSDLGESFGSYTIGNDEAVLDYITSANIACAFHASDPVVMQKTVILALKKGVAIGAHPGYPDLVGFGRRSLNISLEEARAYMIYQIGALNGFAGAYGGRLSHVKPHGALYNDAARNYDLARALAEAVYMVNKELVFVGLAGSEMIRAGRDVGLKTANEVFADRAYNPDGTLVSRKNENAVIHDENECISRVLSMVRDGKVKAVNGDYVSIKADTVCIHGDSPKALEFAVRIRGVLKENGITVSVLALQEPRHEQ